MVHGVLWAFAVVVVVVAVVLEEVDIRSVGGLVATEHKWALM